MVAKSSDIEEISRRMAVIRRELHTNVSESVAGAEALVDWGHYTWTYPWIALGAAATAGYLLYNSRNPPIRGDAKRLPTGTESGEPIVAAIREPSWSVQSLLLGAGSVLVPLAVRAGQNYVLSWLEQQYPTRTVARSTHSPLSAEHRDWAGQSAR